ncbi:uncharacterized protein YktA (UPF0223 family) [Virgibacillus natechei]|uniref:UPF0223 protein J2Z83_000332 n=1 Tax=Virgibacillus natechei TaxID=1216297 RepID=A0ABS4IC68_9BACI|nr:UPF0223 family protein [Virgibacillus natechei]MBP1968240.1 uncharacterized protein YktA (UPF0223 family) [Virgibacillus natechei]UZD14490.1 UPF0223 family protein [Virgibacillus natechei]
MNYQYPFDETWTKEEIIDAVHFFSLVEQAYEQHVKREELLSTYNRFKEFVPSKSEEKTLFNEFETASGYSSYHVVKKAKESSEFNVTMKGNPQ